MQPVLGELLLCVRSEDAGVEGQSVPAGGARQTVQHPRMQPDIIPGYSGRQGACQRCHLWSVFERHLYYFECAQGCNYNYTPPAPSPQCLRPVKTDYNIKIISIDNIEHIHGSHLGIFF